MLTRQGIDWRYRATRNSILFRPMFGPHFGWQPMCGRYGCQDITFERVDYRELDPAADREDRDARLDFTGVWSCPGCSKARSEPFHCTPCNANAEGPGYED